MVGKSVVISKFRHFLPFFTAAFVLSSLMVWGVEQIVVARDFQRFQENLNRQAAHLADGRKKAVVLGSMITMGGVNPVIRETAQGSLPPGNPQVMDLLMRLHQSFDLGNIRVVNATGKMVAYFTKSGKSGTGEVRSSRPYFIASMAGHPSMYPALGHTSGARGFYIAAPIFEKDAAINVSSLGFAAKLTPEAAPVPKIIGAVVAKLGFEEVDYLLKQESDALAVVSPEGVIFASNVPAWQFRVLGSQKDLDSIKNEQRVNEAFEKEPPRLLDMDDRGRLLKEGHWLKMAQASIDWRDPHGSWRLVGFVDPLKSFGNPERISVGAITFAFIMLFGGWWKARLRARRKTEQVASLLDNSGQGFLSFGPDLIIDAEFSRACETMLGQSPAGLNAANVFFHEDEARADLFCTTIPSVLAESDAYTRESMLSLLPSEIQRDDTLLKTQYKLLANGKFMVVLTDITEERRVTTLLDDERCHLELIVKAVSDSHNFFDAIDAFRKFLADDLPGILNGQEVPLTITKALYREVHTCKGLLNQFSFSNAPKVLHDIETSLTGLIALGDTLTRQKIAEIASIEALQRSFDEDLAVLTDALGEEFLARGECIILSEGQERLLEKIATQLLRGEIVDTSVAQIHSLLKEICNMRKVSFRNALMSFDGMIRQVAKRMDKEVAPIEVTGGSDIWLDSDAFRAFLHTLTHVFRNAVVHGIETPESRWEAGKDEAGRIFCSVALVDNAIELTIADDGSGINLDALRERVVAAGVYTSDQVLNISDDEIAQMIFMDTISTQKEVNELAGRGVGLAAVLNETKNMGGRVVVKSVAGQGTQFLFTLPIQQTVPNETV